MEVPAFIKKYPAVTISIGGGGSGTGRALVDTNQIDIGASSALWQTGPTTDSNTGITFGGRETEVIQAAGQNAHVWETEIGTGMIVVIGNLKDGQSKAVKIINIVNASFPTSYDATNFSLNITYADLKNLYQTGSNASINTALTNSGTSVTVTPVSRSDDSGTEQTFAPWIGLADSANDNQIYSTYKSLEKTAQGNQGIRDYVANNVNSIGFVDIGFAAGGVNGNAADLPAMQNGVVAGKTTDKVGGTYDLASQNVNGQGKNGLARNLYYYSQPGAPSGAVKAYLDFVMSQDGQALVQQAGFFSP